MNAPRETDASSPEDDIYALTQALIATRHNVSPKRLVAPGPSPQQLGELLELAAAAPDHGRLNPWRFILVPVAQRHRLGEAYALALIDRDPEATPTQIEAARAKALRAPVLLVAVACLGQREPDMPPLERMISMGAAIQNLLLGAHALGYGVGLTSGQAMGSPRLHRLCGLAPGEVAVCCVNIGSIGAYRPTLHARPLAANFYSVLPD
jgi:nitroreductase